MKTYAQFEAAPDLLAALMRAVSKLKKRLLQQYEQIYPDLGEIIRYVIEEEQANAWSLSPQFPHLVLPDLVEAHIAQLGLQPTFFEPDKAVARSALREPRELPGRAPEQVYPSLIPEALPTY
jgi:hypothetical protein